MRPANIFNESHRKEQTKRAPRKHHTGGWGKTAKNIELYSSVYRTAWKQISPQRKREQPNISLRLHASIRRQLNEGATDPLLIAIEAFKALGESEPGTLKPQEELNRRCRQHPSPISPEAGGAY